MSASYHFFLIRLCWKESRENENDMWNILGVWSRTCGFVGRHRRASRPVHLLQELPSAAGAHIWASKPCVVFANEKFLAVHTKDGGEIEISLPHRVSRVTDSLTGETVAENVARFTCVFAAPDTRLFGLEQPYGHDADERRN